MLGLGEGDEGRLGLPPGLADGKGTGLGVIPLALLITAWQALMPSVATFAAFWASVSVLWRFSSARLAA